MRVSNLTLVVSIICFFISSFRITLPWNTSSRHFEATVGN